MAAPESNKCTKCFHSLPAGALTCPECGAPVGNASGAETEADVYPDLARANLARMRGDYKQAEDQLLSVLKRFPNNPSANEMLGDLAAEREDFEHAVQWYEMALEIVPTSASIARKIKNARASIQKKDDQDTTAQLGLPDPSSRVPVIVGIAIVFILAIVTGAYFLGAKGATAQNNLPAPVNKINASQPDQAPTTNPDEKSNPVTPPAATVSEEQSLLDALKAKAADSSSIIALSRDPRQNALIVTYNVNKDDKLLPARIARDTFSAIPDYPTVTVRGVEDGKIVFMADANRAKLDSTQTAEYKQAHPDENAWAAEIFENIWPAPNSSNPPSVDTPNTASTAGDGKGN